MPEGLSPQQRRTYLLLLLAIFLYFFGASFLLLLPKLFKGLGATETELGWLIGMPLISFVLLAPYAGYLTDRFSGKRLALAGIALAAVSGYGLAHVDGVGAEVWALRLLHGAGHAFTYTPIFSMVAKLMTAEHKARGIAFFTVVVQIGNVLGSLLGSVLVARVSFAAFLTLSAALMVLGGIACLLVRDDPSAAPAPVVAKTPYLALMSERRLWSGFLMIALLGGAFGMALQFVPTYLDFLHAQGVTREAIGSQWYLTTTLVSVAAVRLLFSGRVYRPGNERVLTLCMVGVPVSVLLLVQVSGIPGLVVAAVLFGVTYGLLFPGMNAMVLVRAGSGSQGAVTGVLAMLYEIGFRGLGFVMGPIAAAAGYFNMFGVLAGLLALGMVGFLVLEQERARWLFGARAKSV